MSIRLPAVLAMTSAVLALVGAGCGSSSNPPKASATAAQHGRPAATANPNGPEINPAGDIPDNQVYVRYRPPGATYSVKVPEGWARSAAAPGHPVVFTDKLNHVQLEDVTAGPPPSVSQVRQKVVPQLKSSVKGFRPGSVTQVQRHAGPAVLVTYLAAAPPNPVTGKRVVDSVERYAFFHKGHEAVLTLSGPKGADNVDPWRIITNSVTWAR